MPLFVGAGFKPAPTVKILISQSYLYPVQHAIKGERIAYVDL